MRDFFFLTKADMDENRSGWNNNMKESSREKDTAYYKNLKLRRKVC